MRGLLLLFPALFTAIVDLALFSNLRPWGIVPSLSVAMIAVCTRLRPREEAMILAPLTGLMLGLLGNEPLGASMVGLTLIVWVGLRRGPRAKRERLPGIVALAFVGAGIYTVTVMVLSLVFAGAAISLLATIRQVTAGSVGTTILAIMLYLPLARMR